MIEVAYISEASSTLAPDEVFKIIETSARNNLRDDLTGFLIFADNRFFQVVEGPAVSMALSDQRGIPRRALLAGTNAPQISSPAGKSFPPFQLFARGDPLSRDDVCPLPAELAECRGPAVRARDRCLP